MFSCESLCELDKKDMSPSYREYSESVEPARGSCPEMLKELEILVTDRQRMGGHKSKVKQTTCLRGAGIHRMRPRLSACMHRRLSTCMHRRLDGATTPQPELCDGNAWLLLRAVGMAFLKINPSPHAQPGSCTGLLGSEHRCLL